MTTDDISKSLNSGKQVDMAILDFSKALIKFHINVSFKRKYYGIDGNTRTWINSFLTDRKQQVIVDNATSDTAMVTSRVPQGTVLTLVNVNAPVVATTSWWLHFSAPVVA